MIRSTIVAKYPNMKVLSSYLKPGYNPTGGLYDTHIYPNADQMVAEFSTFDASDRTHTILVGKYAVIHNTTGETHQLVYPTMRTSCAEAVFLIGCERNSDVIIGSAYGQMMQNSDYASNITGGVTHSSSTTTLPEPTNP
jgi:alpha-L-arabinofuranosidase